MQIYTFGTAGCFLSKVRRRRQQSIGVVRTRDWNNAQGFKGGRGIATSQGHSSSIGYYHVGTFALAISIYQLPALVHPFLSLSNRLDS